MSDKQVEVELLNFPAQTNLQQHPPQYSPNQQQFNNAPPNAPQGRGMPPNGPQGRGMPPNGPQGRGMPPNGPQGRGMPPNGPQGRGTPPNGPQGRGMPPQQLHVGPPGLQQQLNAGMVPGVQSELNVLETTTVIDPKKLQDPQLSSYEVVSDDEVSKAAKDIGMSYFSPQKLAICEELVKDRSITTKQAKLLLQQFKISYEQKIVIADYLFKKLVDVENLDDLLECFDFSLDRTLVKQHIGLEKSTHLDDDN